MKPADLLLAISLRGPQAWRPSFYTWCSRIKAASLGGPVISRILSAGDRFGLTSFDLQFHRVIHLAIGQYQDAGLLSVFDPWRAGS
jgi:hypothetical protein